MLYKFIGQQSLHAFNKEGGIHLEAVIIHFIKADTHI